MGATVLTRTILESEHRLGVSVWRPHRRGLSADAQQPCWRALFAFLQRGHQATESGTRYGATDIHASILMHGPHHRPGVAGAASRLAGKRRFDRQRAMDYSIAMITIRSSRPASARVVEIWRRAVDATHDFLSPEDRQAIDEMVCGFLPQRRCCLPWTRMTIRRHSCSSTTATCRRCSSTGLPRHRHRRRAGAPRPALHPRMTTDVNEQNDQAVGFYERMGFKRIGRSALDDQGRPYPLIRLAYQA